MTSSGTSGRMERLARRWWFYLLLALALFLLPPYASEGYEWWEISDVIRETLTHSLGPYRPLFPILHVVFAALILSLAVFGNAAARLFNAYAAFNYALIAVLQNTAVTERYGFTVLTGNVAVVLAVAAFWAWEASARRGDFTPRRQPLWRYWVIPPAVFAFWLPINLETLELDFNPTYLLTSDSVLAFCMMTPVYVATLTLYHPRVNREVLRVTSFVGTLIGIIWFTYFFVAPEIFWLIVAHVPLMVVPPYGLALSFRSSRGGG